MKRSETEKYTDAILGEAVIYLLNSRAPVNISALIARLKEMALSTQDDRRREVIKTIINDISNRKFAKSVASDNRFNSQINTVQSLFGNANSIGTKKIH